MTRVALVLSLSIGFALVGIGVRLRAPTPGRSALAAHGASLDARNKRGQTPLDAALARTDRSNRQLRPDAVAALKELSGVPAAAPGGESTSTATGANPALRAP